MSGFHPRVGAILMKSSFDTPSTKKTGAQGKSLHLRHPNNLFPTDNDVLGRRYSSQPNAKPATTDVPDRRFFSQPTAPTFSEEGFPEWLQRASQHMRSLNIRDSRWDGILECWYRLEIALDFPDSQV